MIENDGTIHCQRQRRKRHVLQRTIGHDNQPFVSQFSRHRGEYHSAQLSVHLLKLRIPCFYSRPSLLRRFQRLEHATSRERLGHFLRHLFNLCSLRQFETLQRISCYQPKITALLTQRVFEQHCVRIQLLLNTLQVERLRLS